MLYLDLYDPVEKKNRMYFVAHPGLNKEFVWNKHIIVTMLHVNFMLSS